jgi:PPOX class probable FMN-dependent enzyme
VKIETIDQLELIYGKLESIGEGSMAKVVDHLIPPYRAYVEASPFVALATIGPEGLDCSPRGDKGQAVYVHDERTLLLPDRRGNNRIDSLRNIVRDPRVALLFLLPGSGTTFRVNGRAHISTEPGLLDRLKAEGKPPRTVIVVEIVECYFQCARAIVRAELWNPENFITPGTLPTPGDVLAMTSQGRVGGKEYDETWPARAAATMW